MAGSILRATRAPTDPYVLSGLQVQIDTNQLRKTLSQPRNHFVKIAFRAGRSRISKNTVPVLPAVPP